MNRDARQVRLTPENSRSPNATNVTSSAMGFGCSCQPVNGSAGGSRARRHICKACVQVAVGDGRQRWIQHTGTAATDEALLTVAMSKRKTQTQIVTPQFVKALCEPHLIPRTVDDGSSCSPYDALPDRRSLPVDHRCRCSTNLMQLATRVSKAMDELEVRHWDEVAQLKKQVALANAISHEWKSAFGSRGGGATSSGAQITPLDVWRELEALKKEKDDWTRERQLLRRQQVATSIQVDELMQQLR
jgi:hypothetical protein